MLSSTEGAETGSAEKHQQLQKTSVDANFLALCHQVIYVIFIIPKPDATGMITRTSDDYMHKYFVSPAKT